MPILPSRSREIDALIRRLRGPSVVDRDAAIARLRLLGAAATPALTRALSGNDVASITGALTVAEAGGDPRLARPVLALLGHDDPQVAAQAAEACAAFSGSATSAALGHAARSTSALVSRSAVASLLRLWHEGATEALDALLGILFDQGLTTQIRLLALTVVDGLPSAESKAIRQRLAAMGEAALMASASAPSPKARQRVGTEHPARNGGGVFPALSRLRKYDTDEPARAPRRARPAKSAELRDSASPAGLAAVEHLSRASTPQEASRLAALLINLGAAGTEIAVAVLPDTEAPLAVGILASAIERHPAPEAVPALDRALRRLTRLPHAHRDPVVAEARARVHLALAATGSPMGLYDLRDLLATRPTLGAGSLLRAAGSIGDASLLPRLAALAHDDPAHEASCREAVLQIVRRGRVRRSAKILQGLRPEHAATLDRLWPARRHAPSRQKPATPRRSRP
jgi:hypothetical protein